MNSKNFNKEASHNWCSDALAASKPIMTLMARKNDEKARLAH